VSSDASIPVAMVPLADIAPSATNPRKTFDKIALEELTESVRQHGVLQPILVRRWPADRKWPTALGGAAKLPANAYEVVAGERRLRAAVGASLPEIPVLVRDLDDTAVIEIQVIENLQRTDLHPLDEAEGYSRLLSAKSGYDVARIAERVGRSVSYVYDRLKLMALVEDARELFRSGALPAGHAIILSRLKPEDQARALRRDEDGLGGLWSHERLLFNPDDDGDEAPAAGTVVDKYRQALKPVSAKELQSWVDANVRLAAEEADRMLFPELVDTVSAAAERAEQVVRITHETLTPEAAKAGPKIILGRSWKRADGQHGSKACGHSVIGTIEIGPARGEVLRVCVDKQRCTVHWNDLIKARKKREKDVATSGAKGEDREALRRSRADEDARRRDAEAARWVRGRPEILQAVAVVIRKAPTGAGSALGKFILGYFRDSAWRSLDNLTREAEKLCPPGKTAADLVRYMALYTFVDAALDGDSGEIVRAAKAFGVDAKKIVDRVAAAAPPPAKCRKCGCTEDKACPGGCAWAKEPDPKTGLGLCTSCVPAKKAKPGKAA